MKAFCIAAFFVLTLISCKKTEKEPASVNYAQVVIGTTVNGRVQLADISAIKAKWEEAIKDESKNAKLSGFEILKGTVEGDEAAEYYMLVARTDDGAVKTASLLSIKDGKLYLGQDNDSGRPLPLVICRGLCDDACAPVVNIRNGRQYINCTPCLDCKKHETEVR
jgi:low affinity Fe/Cu permease